MFPYGTTVKRGERRARPPPTRTSDPSPAHRERECQSAGANKIPTGRDSWNLVQRLRSKRGLQYECLDLLVQGCFQGHGLLPANKATRFHRFTLSAGGDGVSSCCILTHHGPLRERRGMGPFGCGSGLSGSCSHRREQRIARATGVCQRNSMATLTSSPLPEGKGSRRPDEVPACAGTTGARC